MKVILFNISMEAVQTPLGTIQEQVSKSFFTKPIFFVIVLVIVLVAIGFYLYKKYFCKKSDEKPSTNNGNEIKKQILNPNNEYYLLDPDGNPILISPFFNDIVKMHILKRNNVIQPQQIQERPKLIHPDESEEEEQEQEENNEDENVASQDLTNAEIEELKKQLLAMEKSQSQQILAQNDDE